jgi:putative FmdB family regulatory protein
LNDLPPVAAMQGHGALRNWLPPIIEGFASFHSHPSTAMPIYAYKCASCGHSKDVLQKISDAPLSVCPACGAQTFSKQLTAAGFQLKGSGWYVTDFRGGNTGAPAGGTDSQADGKTDTKTDAKSETKPADAKPSESSAPAKSDSTPTAAAGSRH